jgi:formylglycine-generating enzyme required for sulfatase activity
MEPDSIGRLLEAQKAARSSYASPSAKNLINTIGMKFVQIEAGEFFMGCSSGKSGLYDEETRHKVKLTKGFLIAATTITQKQWQAVMGTNPSRYKFDGHPVEQVSWEDAAEFCRNLSLKEGRHYRLPTEAEWEYACRAGTKTVYSFGDDPKELGEYAWFTYNTSFSGTRPVGQKKPNAWGLHDMHGNVYEWCADWHDDYPQAEVTNPTGPDEGKGRIIRGGNWSDFAESCTSAHRNGDDPGSRKDFIGFRVCLSLDWDNT